jgi:acetylornithine deacetylase
MDTLAWLSRLIGFDTTSRGSNLELIQNIKEWLADHAIQSALTYDESKLKANLLATLPAANGQADGGIVLSGHTDVVPVDGQQWDTDPFTAALIENKVYGRGACDMKGFLAVVLALVPTFQKLNLKEPLHLAFSYDEEVGCQGVGLLIQDLSHRGIKPWGCIVGEPTNMRPIMGHKGIQLCRCRVVGLAVHSSLTPQGCNAIEYAGRLISFIRDLANQFRQKGPFDKHYDVPFTSISTNMIQGGIAGNIIPAECEFYFEFRHLPQVNPTSVMRLIEAYSHELVSEMKREYEKADIKIDLIACVPAFEATENAEIYQRVRAISGVNEIFKVAYATEAGLFQAANIPTLVCGPGSIEQAHRANEYVTLSQLNECETFLLELVRSGNSN